VTGQRWKGKGKIMTTYKAFVAWETLDPIGLSRVIEKHSCVYVDADSWSDAERKALAEAVPNVERSAFKGKGLRMCVNALYEIRPCEVHVTREWLPRPEA
jgi:hypothetical protein